jgi:hypothetical protein
MKWIMTKTKLSLERQQELANYRRLLLAKNDFAISTEEEQAAFWKCINVAEEYDGLPSPFVVDRLYEIYRIVHKNEDRLSTQT